MKDWRQSFMWKGVIRWRFTGNFDRGVYLGAKITHSQENERRRRQIAKGQLAKENGLWKP